MPRLEYRPKSNLPTLFLVTQTLYNFMWMELVLMASQGSGIGICGYCSSVFVTGSRTHLTVPRQYCSDRCRVAALRARKSGRASPTGPSPILPHPVLGAFQPLPGSLPANQDRSDAAPIEDAHRTNVPARSKSDSKRKHPLRRRKTRKHFRLEPNGQKA